MVVSTDGTLLADVGRGYGPTAPVDAFELDVRGIWAGVAAVLREAAQRTPSDPVDALAVPSVGDAF